MPKQTYKIEFFHGGLNTNADPRDMDKIESLNLTGCKISNIGRLSTLGQFDRDASTSHTLQILPNRGLFTMDADRKVTNNAESNETLIIAYDDGGNSFDIKDSGGWNNAEISLDTSHPVFYNADGILRIGDGSFSNEGQWYGYIAGAKFDGLLSDSGDVNDWASAGQSIVAPTSGVCLISDPEIGSDGDTVNSSNSEYDGNIADGSGNREPLVHSAINLRVGIQHTNVFETGKTAWERNSGSPGQCTIDTPAETEIYPLFGNEVLKIEGTDNQISSFIRMLDSDSGTDLSFKIGIEECLAFGLNITTAELSKLEFISLTLTGNVSGNIKWKFYGEELIANAWNVCVCNADNITSQSDQLDMTHTFTGLQIDMEQKYGSAYGTANGDNAAADLYLCTPIVALNPRLEGYQSGEYEFHYTWLYDDSKQESKPFQFGEILNNTNEPNKVNIVGGSVLFNFDTYILPCSAPVSCTIDVSEHRIDKSSH